MLELLVVLIIMALSAAVVLPSLAPPARPSTTGWESALTNARRTAIRRGEGVRFRLEPDGVWVVVPVGGGDAVDSGRTSVTAIDSMPRVDVIIDPLGSCLPADTRDGMRFDTLRCTWHAASASE